MKKENRIIKKLLTPILALALVFLLLLQGASTVFAAGATVTVKIPVSKELTGQGREQTFTYELTPKKNAPMPQSNSGVSTVQITTQTTGNATFDGITYTDIGYYYYTIKEQPGETNYDDSIYDVTVLVTWKDGIVNSMLESTMIFAKQNDSSGVKHDGGNFVGDATAAPEPIEVDPPVKKVISGDKPRVDSVFTFCMEADDQAFPMPKGSSEGLKVATVKGEGEVEFGFSTYTKAGVYTYRIYERQDVVDGYTFDRDIYKMTVTVVEENGELKAERTIQRNDGETVKEMKFNNQYKTPVKSTPKPSTPKSSTTVIKSVGNAPKTGDTSNVTWFAVLAGVSAAGIFFILWFRYKRHEEEKTTVNKDRN